MPAPPSRDGSAAITPRTIPTADALETMSTPEPPDDFQRGYSSRLLDVLIRAGFIAVLAALCYVVFAPFLTLMVWAVILAVTLYPLHLRLARRVGGRQGLAATIVVIAGCLLIITPTALLLKIGRASGRER